MNNRLRYGILATALGVLGVTLSVLGFLAARSPIAAELAASSGGIASLLTGLAFTACAVVIVLHYGRRSMQLAAAYHELHRVTLQRERSEAALRESERFTRATLDAMDARIAVLDADGVVMAVNRAWRAPGHPLIEDAGLCDVGSHYLALCEGIADARTAEGQRVADAIREVMSGARADCTVEDRIPGIRELLVTRITRFAGRGPLRLVLAHHLVAAVEPALPDPTEVRRAEEALVRERAFLRQVVDLDANPIFAKDAAGRFTLANQATAALYGTTVEEMLGKTDTDLAPDDALVADVRRTDPETADGQSGAVTFDEQVRDRTGNVRWFQTVERTVPSPDGQGDVSLGVSVEVTERKRLEIALRVSEERNAELAERVADRTRERDRFATALHDADQERQRADEDRQRADEERRLADEGRQRADAEHQRAAAEHRRADDEHQRATEEWRDLYDRAPCGYCSLDARGTIVATNETALAWLGYARDEVVGTRAFADLLTPRSRERFAAIALELGAGGGLENLELDVVRRDGSILPVSMSATAMIDADGGRAGSRCTLIDVSERRHTAAQVAALHEALAARARELEQANQDRESFSHSASRDLRASLRAIDDAARVLLDEGGDRLDAAGRQRLGVIRESASHMAQAVDALLELSRLDRRPLDRSPVDMTALARTVADEVGRRHRTRDVVVVVEGLAPAVGDVGMLRQLFANLVGNAFKFTSQVAHPCVDVGSVDADGTPIYYVRDNGAGFDMRDADQLFHAVEGPDSLQELDGTGLGLALVQRIVDRHGGRVWAEGRVGDGATFFFTLGGEAAADTPVPTE